ncbi:hypothetical protein FOA43_002721 [Brettanomyces nanus]|uniref:Hikeshi-like domain-containing protein n=1 Tax=Eeniella nana TaxID=13502 RepID=A0A875S339_EENNA|nr:uncharacterized protein FOA43_002721 [Brettanomyces nanus]QPG75368.1 hypothetical protein FOA43_002721 [Brettanomyces nanus]
MFGSTLAGRAISLAQQIDSSQYTIKYDELSVKNVYHLSIFLLPNIQFDPSFVALIYYQFQVNGRDASAPPFVSTEFKLLGGLTAQKQSAIFKINPGNIGSIDVASSVMPSEGDIDMDGSGEGTGGTGGTGTGTGTEGTSASIILGISIEPNDTALPQLEQLKLSGATNAAYNSQSLVTVNSPANAALAASKDLTQSQVLEFSNKIIGNAYNFLSSFADSNNKVSMNKFNDWWNRFKSRMSSDPGYLKRLCEAE